MVVDFANLNYLISVVYNGGTGACRKDTSLVVKMKLFCKGNIRVLGVLFKKKSVVEVHTQIF